MKYKFSPLALFLSSIVLPLFVVSSVSAQSDADKCIKGIKAKRSDWSDSEKFVWQKLCNEQEADLVDFKKQKEKIRFKFLKDILLNDDYNKLLPTRIKIKNAIFDDKIDLVSENINKEINLTNSTFRNIVDLSYSTFSKSVNFDESEFNQGLIFNDGIVKGGLSFRNTKFNKLFFNKLPFKDVRFNKSSFKDTKFNKSSFKNAKFYESSSDTKFNKLSSFNFLDQCSNLLNLQRIKVEGDLKIIKTIFSCRNPNLKGVQKQAQDSNYLIDLNAAKIKVSVYLEEVSLVIDTRTDRNENMFQLGVGLVAAEIGDAIIIDQTKVAYKQIEIINMSNIKARALEIAIK